MNQEPLFSCPPKKKPLFTHVVILTWVDSTLSILAQERIAGTNPNHPNKVMFKNHVPGKQPQQEAHTLALAVAKKQSKKFMPMPTPPVSVPDYPPDLS